MSTPTPNSTFAAETMPAHDPADWTTRIVLGDSLGLACPPSWLRASYDTFRENLVDPAYPCYFGSVAERNGDLYYAFANGDDLSMLPSTLVHFIQISVKLSDRRNNLVVFFQPENQHVQHADHRGRFWEVLQYLHDLDSAPSPHTTLADPSDYLWEFPFRGTLFFVVGASPTYARRRSRNLGPGLIMIFQPRDVFEVKETGETISDDARQSIRERIRRWDQVDVHPDLGRYPTPGNLEWKQYFLSDDSERETGRCPFHSRPFHSRRDAGPEPE